MINNVIKISKKGLLHEQCEDSIYVDEKNGVFVVCDGVSNSLNGGYGAKALSKNIGNTISTEKARKRLAYDNAFNVRNTMVRLIRESTDLTTKELGCSVEDIASTMIVVSIWEDVITVIHAGDGAVFAAPEAYQDETPLILSYPDNDAKQRVFPAASPRQLERMRVIHLNASDIKCLAFGTDGFTDAYLRPQTNGFSAYDLNEVFKVNTVEDFENLIKRKHLTKRPIITDDISAIILKFDNGIEYTGDQNTGLFENLTETSEKVMIKSKEVEEPDNTTIEPSSISELHEVNGHKKVGKTVLIILSALVIFCVAAVCVLGNNLNKVSHDADKQISNLSEEISSLQGRVDELEDATTETETTTSNIEKTTSINNEDELTKTTKSTIDDEHESWREISNTTATKPFTRDSTRY